MSNEFNKYDLEHRGKAKAFIIVIIIALLAALAVYYLAIKDSGVGPPLPKRELSQAEKLEVLAEIGKTNQSSLSMEERQNILDQLVEDSPKSNQ
jgi:hypothetical protein